MDTIIELGKVTEETKGDGGDKFEGIGSPDCDEPEVLDQVGDDCPR
jgi:hypothetical protein